MDLHFIIEGVIIGLAVAAPVGPIGVLCIRRSLVKGQLSGFLTGLGAATADACYGAVAGFGLTSISVFLIGQKDWLQIIGIAFLFYLGISIFFEKPATEKIEKVKSGGLAWDYLSTFGLTITNPMTIISFATIFAGIGILNTPDNYLAASLLVFGVFVGSALWWLILSSGAGLLSKRTDNNILWWVNKVSGSLILLFAVFLILNI